MSCAAAINAIAWIGVSTCLAILCGTFCWWYSHGGKEKW